MATAAAQLAEVEAAITACLNGQSYRLPNGTVVERPDLDTLYAMRRDLETRAAAEATGTNGGTYKRLAFKGAC